MSASLRLPDPDLRALASGDTIVAFAARAGVDIGDEVALEASGPRDADELLPRYAPSAASGPPPGAWVGVVEAVHPAVMLEDSPTDDAPHILAHPPDGDLVVLRIYGRAGPVLGDDEFEAMVSAVEGALR